MFTLQGTRLAHPPPSFSLPTIAPPSLCRLEAHGVSREASWSYFGFFFSFVFIVVPLDEENGCGVCTRRGIVSLMYALVYQFFLFTLCK